MKSLLLMSLVFATFVVPALAARDREPVRALKGMALFFAVFVLLYCAYVAFGHPKLFVPHR
jgi:hypothetical protein